MRESIWRGCVVVGGMLFVAACSQPAPPAAAPAPSAPVAASAPAVEAYAPGLGEIMSAQQMRHTKLWLAGQAGNWELAGYEVEELQEGFDDVVKFHPTHKDAPVAPRDAIPRMVTEPMGTLVAAIEKKDAAAFAQAYDAVTAACNNCHKAMDFGFNVVQRPTMNPYPNQIFTPPSK